MASYFSYLVPIINSRVPLLDVARILCNRLAAVTEGTESGENLTKRDYYLYPTWFYALVGFFCFATLIPGELLAQTEVEGNVSGEWTAENSPYILVGTCTVPREETLTIQPGVEIIFTGNDSLYVLGHLVAEGSEEDSIHFHGDFEQENVGRIYLWENEQVIEFSFIIMENIDRLSSFGSEVVFQNCKINSNIANHFFPGLEITECSVNADITTPGIINIQNSIFNTTNDRCRIFCQGNGILNFRNNRIITGFTTLSLQGFGTAEIISNTSEDSARFSVSINGLSEGLTCMDNETNFISVHGVRGGEILNNSAEVNMIIGGSSGLEIINNESPGTFSADASRNCLVEDNVFQDGIIAVRCSDLTISNNDFSNPEEGSRCCDFRNNSGTIVENNRFAQRPSFERNSAVEFIRNVWVTETNDGTWTSNEDLTFTDNTLPCGLRCSRNTNLNITDSYIYGSLEFRDINNITISNNKILIPNGYGLKVYDPAESENIITDNLIYCFGHWNCDGLVLDEGNYVIKNNIITSDGGDFIGISTRSGWEELNLDAGYNCFYHTVQEYPENLDDLYEGDITADPLLYLNEEGDYQLRPDSPCIDAGDPDSDPDGDESRNDIGPFFFDHREDNAPVIITNGLQFTMYGQRWDFSISAVDDEDVTRIWIEDLPEWIEQLPSRDDVDTLIHLESIDIPDSIEQFQFTAFAMDNADQVTAHVIEVHATGHTLIQGEVSGVLRANNSPYFIPYELYIPPDEELVVEPGCVFYFRSVDRELGKLPFNRYRIHVSGKLTAIGTEEDSILFISGSDAPYFEDWHGLYFNNSTDTCKLSYVRISHAAVAVELNNSIVKFQNSYISESKWISKLSSTSHLTYINSDLIAGNYRIERQHAILGESTSTLDLYSCNVENSGRGAGINVYHGEFSENQFVQSDVTIGHNFHIPSSVSFDRNLMMLCDLRVNDAVKCDIWNNTICFGNNGISLHHLDTCNIKNNIIFESFRNDLYCNGLDADTLNYIIQYNRFETFEGCPGNFRMGGRNHNTDIDPNFVGGYPFSFELRGYSDLVDYGVDVGLPFFGEAPDLGCFEFDPEASVPEGQIDIPSDYALYPAFPNPFNSSCTIGYSLPQSGEIELLLFDVTGRQVDELVGGYKQAGLHFIRYEAANLATGMYVLHLDAEAGVRYQKLIIIK